MDEGDGLNTMVINNNTVEQINVALLDLENRIKSISLDINTLKSLQSDINNIKSNSNEKKAGLQSGATYNINISGNASTATHASLADSANTATSATSATTADKAVGVVDYGNTSNTIRIGYHGPGVTADKLLYLAGYTEQEGNSSVKLKDVSKEELIKWLGIPRIKYADYQIPSQTFTQFQQVGIELSKFSSEVTPNNVLCFMVIYWTGVQLIASADWANSSGLKCALTALEAGTGWGVIRCVYMV